MLLTGKNKNNNNNKSLVKYHQAMTGVEHFQHTVLITILPCYLCDHVKGEGCEMSCKYLRSPKRRAIAVKINVRRKTLVLFVAEVDTHTHEH